MKCQLSLLMLFTGLAAAGCGGGIEEYPVAKTTGVVMCNGEPVTGGRIYFEPIAQSGSANAGKTGLSEIGIDGTFTISSYGNEDGAVVGKNRVKVEKGNGPGCECAMNVLRTVVEVDVVAGQDNEFTIDLPKETKADAQAAAREDDDDDDE